MTTSHRSMGYYFLFISLVLLVLAGVFYFKDIGPLWLPVVLGVIGLGDLIFAFRLLSSGTNEEEEDF